MKAAILGIILLSSSVLTSASEPATGLITQLGAPTFSEREQAHKSLAALGDSVRDHLHAARNHDDPEIATRARLLLNALKPEMKPRPANLEGQVQSNHRTTQRIDIEFVNRSDTPLKLYWLDLYGKRKLGKEIPANSSVTQETNPGHLWLVADTEDDGLGIYEARPGASAIITMR